MAKSHDWHRGSNGYINLDYWKDDSYDGCAGPECKDCGFHYCTFCDLTDGNHGPYSECKPRKKGKLTLKELLVQGE